MTCPAITVTGAIAFGRLLREQPDDFDHLISIVGTWEGDGWDLSSDPPCGWPTWNAHPARKLRLVFDDVQQTNSHGDAPTEQHVREIIDFARGADGGHMLIHCAAGVSRSSAVALIVLATHCGDPDIAVQRLCQIRSPMTIFPHANLVRMADAALGFEGRLVAARDAEWGTR